jgi:hypothetical protein
MYVVGGISDRLSTNLHFEIVTDPNYPRQETIKNLLHLVRSHPQLGQVSVSSLMDLGEAIHSSACREETDILIRGTLGQEPLVRNACLQTLQVCLEAHSSLSVECHEIRLLI